MSYKTILVCLTNPHNAERMCKAAATIARMFDAHLIGLHTMQSLSVYPGITVSLSAQFEGSFADAQRYEAKKIEDVFHRFTQKEDFVSEWRCEETKSASAADRIIDHARFADLVILPQPDADHDRPDQTTLQRSVIEASGRPVLVIPTYGEFPDIGSNILVGWSPTKEATRSVHDAIPFMRKGKNTTLFWVSKKGSGDDWLAQSANEIATALDRNGVIANVKHRINTGLQIGDEILNEAADNGIDLIVTGAYGHSRVYDFVVGATTSYLMKHMTAPVLFSC